MRSNQNERDLEQGPFYSQNRMAASLIFAYSKQFLFPPTKMWSKREYEKRCYERWACDELQWLFFSDTNRSYEEIFLEFVSDVENCLKNEHNPCRYIYRDILDMCDILEGVI